MVQVKCNTLSGMTSSTHFDCVRLGSCFEDIAHTYRGLIQQIAVTWQFLINSTNIASNANQTLESTNVAAYDTAVRACLDTGASCIIDIHNYARFEGKVIGQGGPTNAQFASLWAQIAAKVGFHLAPRAFRS